MLSLDSLNIRDTETRLLATIQTGVDLLDKNTLSCQNVESGPRNFAIL